MKGIGVGTALYADSTFLWHFPWKVTPPVELCVFFFFLWKIDLEGNTSDSRFKAFHRCSLVTWCKGCLSTQAFFFLWGMPLYFAVTHTLFAECDTAERIKLMQVDAGSAFFFIQRVLASLGGWADSKRTGCVKCVSSFSELPKSFPSYAQQQQQKNRAQSSEQNHTHLGFVYTSGSTGYINRKSTLWKQSEWRPAYYLKEILSVCVSFLPVVTLFASGIMKCKYLARNWFLKFLHFLFQEACVQEEGLGSHIDTFIQLASGFIL